MHARIRSILVCAAGLSIAACNTRVYVQDGVTDGNVFVVPPGALSTHDSTVRSWVAYSLGRSTCQLAIGGDNPARSHSFDCELKARMVLVDTWLEETKFTDETDGYLDQLVAVSDAGFLDEYVWVFLRREGWTRPDGLELDRFAEWRDERLPEHRAKTRIIGSWNYIER